MKIISQCFISTVSFLFFSNLSFAQCSDAGACQLGHSVDEDESDNLQISFAYKNGYSGKESDVSFHSFQLTTQYKLLSTSTLSLVMPYNFQSGPGGDVNGIGDLIIGWSQKLLHRETSTLTASIGIKLATGDENKEPLLPQVYQPGLGSNDLIFTIDYNYESLSFGAAYQLAGGRNDKEGIRLKRGDDLLMRTSYKFPFNNFLILLNYC